mgnify:CR=1 FL=1
MSGTPALLPPEGALAEPARLAAFAVNERRKWEPVIKRAGIQVD